MTRPISLTIHVRIGDGDGAVVTVRGRETLALRMLVAAGDPGCTPIDHTGPRWSGYVHDLRPLSAFCRLFGFGVVPKSNPVTITPVVAGAPLNGKPSPFGKYMN